MTGIRADGNEIIASGHIMRCITIARELTALGEKVVFFAADDVSGSMIETFASGIEGLETVVLGTDWRDMEGELEILKEELVKRNVGSLLVDSYQVTPRYFQELSRVCRVAYMDDLGKEPYPVDLLINYSGYYQQIGYDSLYEGVTSRDGGAVRMLLGLMYAPLRRQFWTDAGQEGSSFADKETLENRDDKPLRILLTSGGADMHGMLPAALKRADEEGLAGGAGSNETPEWHVAAGSMVKSAEELEAFASSHRGVYIHRNVTDMAALMRSCDLAVAAAGTMLTECAALRLPAVFYQAADNQRYNVVFWKGTGGMIYAGDVSEGTEAARDEAVAAVMDAVKKFDKNRGLLEEMRKALQGVTDGRGAGRIAEELLKMA